METVTNFIFLGSKIAADGDCSHKTKRHKRHYKPKQYIRKQWHHFAVKCLYSQSFGFSSSHVWM